MNQHDDGPGQDHGWVDPAESGLLKQTFSAMASGVDPASPTGPAAAMPIMNRRVRRRRTAKLGGLGGGALALAGALVLGAGQLAPPDQAELLPGTSAPTPEFKLQDGYQPPWLDWSDLTCGMPVADLKSTAPGWSVASAGDIYARTAALEGDPTMSWGMASRLMGGPGTLDASLALVWSRDGVVVDLGPDVFGGSDERQPLLRTDPDGTVEAQGGAATSCAPTETGTDPVFETPLPEGDYEVRVVGFPQVASGQRTAAVSQPVTVHIDTDGAHSPGTRGGESTIEFPEPAEGEVSRFELDRTTDWVTAEMTQRTYPYDTAMRVIGQCEGSDPEAVLSIELVLPSTGKVLGTSQISCDGDEAGSEVGVLPYPESGWEAVDVRLPSVPDGVARAWVSLEPATPVGEDTGPDCSATDFDPPFVPGNSPREGAAATSGAIVIAAMDCDSDALIALAEDSETELMSGAETPEQTFALPESDAEHYRTLAALLTGTRGGQVSGEEPGSETVVWPGVATPEFADSDEAWQEVVDAGLLTAEEAEAQRTDGYQGMRIAISATDGTWQYYSAGD
ncbi:hypothetical protein C8K30_110193 [Promicromonospora sp. AC04]|uniref:hypothetical protein n=1 Tax=Promicromonospora sp. AC04 TaxID=2135723 RepID=UPI000D382DF0|nr:hypothetical protein [Promicromonospora sp. AC04]PUB24049.1 hypothetical protein C8K30_110193 [Promicromonospora sp. AC04]